MLKKIVLSKIIYNYISDRIRSVDKNHIIFYQPIIGNFEDLFKSGFDTNYVGVGNSVYSYHVYCPVFQADVHHTHPNAVSYGICKLDNFEIFKTSL